jgi:hypothetical protein
MQEIPNWIIDIINTENITCRNCKVRFNVNNLMSIGIQESNSHPHNDMLCIGMFCSKCREIIIFELKEKTLIGFAFDIIDQEAGDSIYKKDIKKKIKNKSSNNRKPIIKKSKITLKEINEIKRFLKSKDLKHEDFLIALGMLPEEIEKYNYKKE